MMNLKKNKKILIIIALILLALVAIVGGCTFAKYITKVEGRGEGNIARMLFNVKGINGSEEPIKISKINDGIRLLDGKIGPGTSGEFEIVVDAIGSEVGVEYSIEFPNETNKPRNLKFIYNYNEYSSLEELSKVLKGSVNIGTKEEYKIKWEWPFTTGTTEEEIAANDVIDTQDSINGNKYTFDVIVKGTQMMPETINS